MDRGLRRILWFSHDAARAFTNLQDCNILVPSHSLYHPVLDIAKLMMATKHYAAVPVTRSQEAAAESSQEAEVQQPQPSKEDQQDAKPSAANHGCKDLHSRGTRFSIEGEASSCGSSWSAWLQAMGMCRRHVVQVRKEASKGGELLRKERKQRWQEELEQDSCVAGRKNQSHPGAHRFLIGPGDSQGLDQVLRKETKTIKGSTGFIRCVWQQRQKRKEHEVNLER